MIIYYIFKQLFKAFVYNKYSQTDLYKGFKLYSKIRKNHQKDVKSLFRVLYELNKISCFWKAFPDSYFRFGMFVDDFGDINKMLSFVPQEAYSRYALQGEQKYNVIIDDKILFHDLMTYYGVPVPERFFTYRGGVFMRNSTILSEMEIDNILGSAVDERIFVKRYTGGAGSGISVLTRNIDGNYVDSNNHIVTASYIRNRYNEDYIFEKQIVQSEEVAKFNADSVNTIRVLTYNNKIVSASIRFGGKGDFIDNVSKGGVAVSIDIRTGKLGSFGMRMYDINHYYEHPDSNLKFKGEYIPQWFRVKELIMDIMVKFPYFKSVGFDIAITDNGPVIVEINTGAGIGLSQMGKEYGLIDIFKGK